jgi:hypothetical protein
MGPFVGIARFIGRIVLCLVVALSASFFPPGAEEAGSKRTVLEESPGKFEPPVRTAITAVKQKVPLGKRVVLYVMQAIVWFEAASVLPAALCMARRLRNAIQLLFRHRLLLPLKFASNYVGVHRCHVSPYQYNLWRSAN